MSVIGLALNLLLASLLAAALAMGWRLDRRLKALRDAQGGFAASVSELSRAAARAEQGLADLRAASGETTDLLADRIEKARGLAARLEKLLEQAPSPLREAPPRPDDDRAAESRLGALLAAAREARAERIAPRQPLSGPRPSIDEDLFEDPPVALRAVAGGRR